MTEDAKFSFGQFKRFCRSVGNFYTQLENLGMGFCNRMDWPKGTDLGPSESRGY